MRILLAIALLLAGVLFLDLASSVNAVCEYGTKEQQAKQSPEKREGFACAVTSRSAVAALDFIREEPEFVAAAATIVIAIFTMILGGFTISLASQTKVVASATIVAANAAELSARAAIALQMPIIRIQPAKSGYGSSRKENESTRHYIAVHSLIFSNLGATKAFPIEIKYGWTVGQGLPPSPTYLHSDQFKIGYIFEPDPKTTPEKYLREAEIEIPEDGYDKIRAGDIKVWFYCLFVFLDFMKVRHEHGFCWQRYETFGQGGFIEDATPAYNHHT